MWYEIIVSRGYVAKDLKLKYMFSFEESGDFQTIKENGKNVKILPGYLIKIDFGYEKPQLCIRSAVYYQFASLMQKSVNLISENLYDIFPDAGNTEFSIDSKVMERFMIEKAMSSAGMTIVPAVYVNETNECFPGIKILSDRGDIILPLTDAITFSCALMNLNPIQMQMSFLSMIGKFD